MILDEVRISDEQFDKFIETSKNIAELPLYIDETPAISIAAMSNRARRIKRLFGLDMIVVDYIQLMKVEHLIIKMVEFKKFQKLLKD
jgi:replicative DNA helicase